MDGTGEVMTMLAESAWHQHNGYGHKHGREKLYDHGVDHAGLFAPEIPDYDFTSMSDDELVEVCDKPMFWSQVADYNAELEARGIDLFGERS